MDADPPPPPPNLRPEGTPDVVVFAVSGHCFGLSCLVANPEYLESEHAVDTITDVLDAYGISHQTEAFSDELDSYDDPQSGLALRGFLELVDVLRYTKHALIADYENPTTIIVMAHSHGTVWAHNALHLLEWEEDPIPVWLLVDLDGVSIGWEAEEGGVGDDWQAAINQRLLAGDLEWPFFVADPAASITVPGVDLPQDIEDVVPHHVALNFEAWSTGLYYSQLLRDVDDNHRADGTTDGILWFPSAASHSGIDDPGSDALQALELLLQTEIEAAAF